MPTIQNLLTQATQTLEKQGISNPRLDARLLLAHTLKVPLTYLLAHPEALIDPAQQDCFIALLNRRLEFEPVSRIIGQREFWGLPFTLSSATLDPRPDSESLVETVLKHTPDKQHPLDILDLGTGSGCLLLSLLSELPHAKGVGVDIAAAAVSTAQQNAQILGLKERVQFLVGDWLEHVSGQFDWIISNPPYIPSSHITTLDPDVRLYDPWQALDGGEDGLDCYRILAASVGPFLKPHGHIALEIGQGQEKAVTALMTQAGFECLTWAPDLTGILRCGVFKIS